MAMLERNDTQKIVTGSLALCLGISAILLFGMIIIVSSSLSNISSTTVAYVHFGPLNLIELSKSPVQSGGYSASIVFQKGMAYYALIAMFAAGLLAYLRLLRKKNRT